MASQRALKDKMQTVKNISQITKAMEMVSATKMRKSQEVALRARPYAQKALSLLSRISTVSEKEDLIGTFSEERSEGKTAFVVVTSDKGLCGSYNSAVLRKASEWKKKEEAEGNEVDIIAVGKKTRDYFTHRHAGLAQEFIQFSDIATMEDAKPLADWIITSYSKEDYGKVVFCSTFFESALVQKVEVHQVLPLDEQFIASVISGIVPKTGKYADVDNLDATEDLQYALEPSAEEIVEDLIRDLVQVEITHLIFEANASEHSARMMAMKNATENAQNLEEELNLELNKARQSDITQELSEISTAKEALSQN